MAVRRTSPGLPDRITQSQRNNASGGIYAGITRPARAAPPGRSAPADAVPKHRQLRAGQSRRAVLGARPWKAATKSGHAPEPCRRDRPPGRPDGAASSGPHSARGTRTPRRRPGPGATRPAPAPPDHRSGSRSPPLRDVANDFHHDRACNLGPPAERRGRAGGYLGSALHETVGAVQRSLQAPIIIMFVVKRGHRPRHVTPGAMKQPNNRHQQENTT